MVSSPWARAAGRQMDLRSQVVQSADILKQPGKLETRRAEVNGALGHSLILKSYSRRLFLFWVFREIKIAILA